MKNNKGKTPMTSVSNNLLMIKMLKKAEVFQCVENLMEVPKPFEAHVVDREFLQRALL